MVGMSPGLTLMNLMRIMIMGMKPIGFQRQKNRMKVSIDDFASAIQ